MTETNVPRPEDDPVWRRLVMDCAAFPHQYPMPAHLAELVRQAILASAVYCLQRMPLIDALHLVSSSPEQLVARVLDDAANRPGDPSVAALHALAHAGQRARAAAAISAAKTETAAGGQCDG